MEEKNYFEMKWEERFNALKTLTQEKLPFTVYDEEKTQEVIDKELKVIEENNWSIDFLIAYEISEIIKKTCYDFRFVGEGCSSFVSSVLEISGDVVPFENGLIFESTFHKSQTTLNCVFGFYLDDYDIAEVIKKLKEKGYNLSISLENEEGYNYYVLSIGTVHIAIYKKKDFLYDVIHKTRDRLYLNRYGVFQEDFIHFLHYSFGYSYEKATEVRFFIRDGNKEKIEEFKQEVFNKLYEITQTEKEEFFDDLTNNLRFATSKAIYVSSIYTIGL